jgi:CubicO group peptidase (beta-lactamase class C family)
MTGCEASWPSHWKRLPGRGSLTRTRRRICLQPSSPRRWERRCSITPGCGLFDPLGITSRPAPDLLAVEKNLPAYERADFAWPHDPQGVFTGFGFLKLTARDMAAFGRLYLDGGRWNGEQVVPTAWVDAATTEQVQANSLANGYGYQWWVTTSGGHTAYAAIGFGGQLIEVVPDLRLVAVFSTDVTETDATVDSGSYANILSAIIRQVENE